jgi:tellurite resistance protein
MIACLAKVAWADGKLLPQEADFFRDTIQGLNLPLEVEQRAWQAVVTPSANLDTEALALLSEKDRRFIADVSLAMAAADGQLSDEERLVLQQLGLPEPR